MSEQEAPVLDTLAQITAVSLQNCDLGNRELMISRIAALAAVDAPAISYLMNVGAAADSGVRAGWAHRSTSRNRSSYSRP